MLQIMQAPYRDGYPLAGQRSDINNVDRVAAAIGQKTLSGAATKRNDDESGEGQLSRWLLGTFGIAVLVSIFGFLLALVGGGLGSFRCGVAGLVIALLGLVVTSACIDLARLKQQSG